MPLTSKGEEVMSALKSEYGAEKGEHVFYAMKNEGKLSGVDSGELDGPANNGQGILSKLVERLMSDCDAIGRRMDGYGSRMDALRADKEEDEDDVTPEGKLEKGEVAR